MSLSVSQTVPRPLRSLLLNQYDYRDGIGLTIVAVVEFLDVVFAPAAHFAACTAFIKILTC